MNDMCEENRAKTIQKWHPENLRMPKGKKETPRLTTKGEIIIKKVAR
jgi:hypothetical protein